ncbi:NAD(P)/FAD-dependent oxidoreductase [Trinickia fusca]|uniref:FAD-binding oxidoreductase n=1 Tax=Trinickia fusca TaxID=2419777 RepID=A0A494XRQ2_9BURK|nr:FAD-binding oxidoreductase [Trinickia fusca]RKP50814.1 FAD-binding oxidoreductase [Trinickia fusca]
MIRCEYAVVGAGVGGSAIAYHLARRGCRVLLADRGTPASLGATAYPGGIIRGFDPDPRIAYLCTQGLDYFLHWDRIGLPGPTPARHLGFLYLLQPSKLAAAQAVIDALGSRGSARILTGAERRKRAPFLSADHAGAAVFETMGGIADPVRTTFALCDGLRNFGGLLLEHAELRSMSAHAGGGWQLSFGCDDVVADRVVLAMGAWLKAWLPSLPIVSRAVSLGCVESSAEIPFPVFDEIVGAYLRPASARTFYCGCATLEDEVEGAIADVPSHVYRAIFERARMTFGEDCDAHLVHGLSGCDAYTSTGLPYLDFVDREKTLYLATGFSGRGYKYALWAGDAVAAELCDDLRGLLGNAFDLTPFRLHANQGLRPERIAPRERTLMPQASNNWEAFQ